VGPDVSEGERDPGVSVRDCLLGHGWLLKLGRKSSPGPFFFLLFFFCLLVSFIDFSYLVQIASNQLCKVSKNSKQHSRTVKTKFS
jgi:hypothetical protein